MPNEEIEDEIIEDELLDDESKEEIDEPGESEEDESDDEEDGDDQDSEELIITIDGEELPPSDNKKAAPSWVRELRKQNRELKAKLSKFESGEQKPGETRIPELPKKPKLEDFDYDTEAYETANDSWYEKKREIDAHKAKIEANQKEHEAEWRERLDGYNKAKSNLKVKDFDEAEDVVLSSFDADKQGILLRGSDNPALIVYALGKNPKKASELSKITNLVKFAWEAGKLEGKMSVSKGGRKPATEPEKQLKGGGGKTPTSKDGTLDRLRKEAEKTGDLSKVIAYKRSLRQKK
jgi:hypothetical protein